MSLRKSFFSCLDSIVLDQRKKNSVLFAELAVVLQTSTGSSLDGVLSLGFKLKHFSHLENLLFRKVERNEINEIFFRRII